MTEVDVDPALQGALGNFYAQAIVTVDEAKHRCSLCQKMFKTVEFVKNHIQNKHPEEVAKVHAQVARERGESTTSAHVETGVSGATGSSNSEQRASRSRRSRSRSASASDEDRSSSRRRRSHRRSSRSRSRSRSPRLDEFGRVMRDSEEEGSRRRRRSRSRSHERSRNRDADRDHHHRDRRSTGHNSNNRSSRGPLPPPPMGFPGFGVSQAGSGIPLIAPGMARMPPSAPYMPMMPMMPPVFAPPPPAGRQLRNYADLDAPVEGTFVPNYGLLLTPSEASRARGFGDRSERDSRSSRDRRSRSRSRSRSVDRDRSDRRRSRSRSRSRSPRDRSRTRDRTEEEDQQSLNMKEEKATEDAPNDQ